MTPDEIMDEVSNTTGSALVVISPGPFQIAVNDADRTGIWLIRQLMQHMGDRATVGNVCDVLNAAQWWTTFWASQSKAAAMAQRLASSPPPLLPTAESG